MATRKYLEDYETDYVTGKNGKIHAEAHYAGVYYRFALEGDALKKARALFSGLTVLMWVCYVVPLAFISSASRTWYSIVPFAFLFPCLCFVTFSVYGLMFEHQPMTRERSDKIYGRGLQAILLTLILAAAAGLGYIIMLALNLNALAAPGDIIHGVCTALILVSAVMISRSKHLLCTIPVDDRI